MSGKGDAYRPVDAAKYAANWPLGPSERERREARVVGHQYSQLDMARLDLAARASRAMRGTAPGITPGEWSEFVDVPAPARCELRNDDIPRTLHQPHEEGHGESGPAEAQKNNDRTNAP